MKLRANEVSVREIDGEMVLLDLRTSKYLSANRVGTILLQLLAEDRSLNELADALVAEFDVPHETALADVTVFVDELRTRGLLEPTS